MNSVKIRRGRPADMFQLMDLYSRVYDGTYSEETVTNPSLFRRSFDSEQIVWMVGESSGQIIGAMNFALNPKNALTKVSGGVVDPLFQAHGIAETLLQGGIDEVHRQNPDMNIFFALVRTNSRAPQRLTAHFNFRQLGIFPNIHHTSQFETHCLTALIPKVVLEKRRADFLLHPVLLPLFNLVAQDHDLAIPQTGSVNTMTEADRKVSLPIETIDAPTFVENRYEHHKEKWQGHHWYSSFHKPNLLLVSTDQTLEVYAHYSPRDQSCLIMALSGYEGCGIESALRAARDCLHTKGIRYLEIGMRAAEIDSIEGVLRAGFTPSAYFPALEKDGEVRHDYVFFSLSFEALYFRHLALDTKAQAFLNYYVDIWSKRTLQFER